MPGRLKITLSQEQRSQLTDLRDHAPVPYLRERAAAVLKIADGISGREVARNRLNRPHWQDTVYEWLHRFQKEGVAGLKIRTGRGRKPAFSPSLPQRTARSRGD